MKIESVAPITVIVLTKAPVAGRVKTRAAKTIGDEAAVEVHTAMLQCTVDRLTMLWGHHPAVKLVMAVDPADGTEDPTQSRAMRERVTWTDAWTIMPQGDGDLGDRIGWVWRHIETPRGVILAIDTPDVPTGHLESIFPALEHADAAVGPVDDGGYWTLAANNVPQPLLEGIPWGGDTVYRLTVEAAERAGVKFHPLPDWFDVDHLEDLFRLRDRTADSPDPAIMRLHERIRDALAGHVQPGA